MNQNSTIRFILLIILIGCLHRIVVFSIHFRDIQELIGHNSTWLTWQYLSIPALSEHFLDALLFLQQTPPIPNIILGVMVKAAGWPFGTAFGLFALQAMLSIATCSLFFYLLYSATGKQWISFALTIVFLLSTDLLIMEYSSFGQTFYENLTMLLLILTTYCLYRFLTTNRLYFLVILGLSVGAVALTRASFSYFFIIPALFLGIHTLSRRYSLPKTVKIYTIYFTCILATHGVWVMKNYHVYNSFSIATSSWKGINFAIGLERSHHKDAFLQSILNDAQDYPDWFIRMIREHGLVHWHPPVFNAYIPKRVRTEHAQIQKIFKGANRTENSIGQRLVSDLYMRAYIRFFFKHPLTILKKYLKSHNLFWRPIRDNSDIVINPFYVKPFKINDLRFAPCSNQFVTQGTWPAKQLKSTCFYTIPFFPLLILVINILALNIVLPLVLLSNAITLLGKRPSMPEAFKLILKYCQAFISHSRVDKSPVILLFLLSCYVYTTIVSNLPEYSENMRFRLAIEPLIWLATVHLIIVWKKRGFPRRLRSYFT